MTARSLALLAALPLLAGCKTVHVIERGQLQKLDGYDVAAKPPPTVLSTTGEVIPFTRDVTLRLLQPPEPVAASDVFHLAVSPERLIATLEDGRTLTLELQHVTGVELVAPSQVKTTILGAAITGLLLGSVLFLALGVPGLLRFPSFF